MNVKKILYYAVCVVSLFDSFKFVLAGPNDPPNLSSDDYNKIKTYFSQESRKTGDPDKPIVWEKDGGRSPWCGDRRDIKVRNVQSLLNCSDQMATEKFGLSPQNPDFINSAIQVMLLENDAAEKTKKHAKYGIKIFVEEVDKYVKKAIDSSEYKKYLTTFSNVLGINYDEAKDTVLALVEAQTIANVALTGSAVAFSVAEIGGMLLTLVNPAVGYLVSFICGAASGWLLGVGTDASNSVLHQQKCANYATLLKFFCDELVSHPKKICQKNVFIQAVDNRDDVWKWVPFNPSVKRNDGAWCGFELIKNLEGAPLFGDYATPDGVKLIPYYTGILTKFTHDELDTVSVNRLLSGIPDPKIQLNSSETED